MVHGLQVSVSLIIMDIDESSWCVAGCCTHGSLLFLLLLASAMPAMINYISFLQITTQFHSKQTDSTYNSFNTLVL